MLILYFFYKCLSFSFCMWLFCLSNGFSGQKIFDDAYQTLYNVFFTSTPIMAYGIFERGLDAHLLLIHPRLYVNPFPHCVFVYFNPFPALFFCNNLAQVH